MSMFFGKVLIVIVVAMIGYVSSHDTCEFAPNSQMAAEMMTLVTDLTETAKKQSSTIEKLTLKLKQANDTCKAQVSTQAAELSSMKEDFTALREKVLKQEVVIANQTTTMSTIKQAIDSCTANVQKQEVIIANQNTTMSTMKQAIDSLTAIELAAQVHRNASIEELKKAVNDIRTEGQDIIAFSVHSPPSGELKSGDTVVYRAVDTNIGGHFDITTSVFTCPYTGLYLLQLSVLSYRGYEIGLQLVIGSDRVALAHADGRSGFYGQGSDMTIHRCQAGSKVKVKYYEGNKIFGGLYTTFSGVLLQKL